ncbi:apolipoprotein N-acyltransferase [bacterium]|nr:apolipoprotein N-acyltransferase [bacterium]
MPRKNKPTKSRIPFILSGILFILAFPPIGWWFLAWIGLLPLLVHARSLAFGLAFRRGWWSGLIMNAGLLYWVAMNTGAELVVRWLSLFGLLLILPLYWGFFAGFWAFLWKRWGDAAALVLPALWVAFEVIKNAPEIGFPWLELGLTQIDVMPVAQLAEIGGIRFVSVWVVAANVAVYLFMQRKHRSALIIALLLLSGAIWGLWRMNHLPPVDATLTAAIVQGNIDPEDKWRLPPDSSIVIYEALTEQITAENDVDLVLWPETAVPVYLGHQMRYQNRIRSLARNIDAAILTGASHYEFMEPAERGHYRYNSAFFFPADGSQPGRYDKIRLVPFGERVPFQHWIPQLGELNFGQAEFTSGNQFITFPVAEGVVVGAQICFESVFSEETAQFVQNGASVLANLTNDAWYGNSSGPYQHAALVRFKCIETRRPLIRAANTGISLAADRTGRIIQKLLLGERGAFIAEVTTCADYQTFYVRHVEMLPRLLSVLALILVITAAFEKPHGRLN